MNRGISLIDVARYLNTTFKDVIPPAEVANIKEGANMLIKHIAANNPVML
jgi:hypothetical protein